MKTLPQEIGIRKGTGARGFIPPQANTDDKLVIEGLIEQTRSAENVIHFLTAGTWVSSLFVGSMSLMWGLINSLQIIAHIPLLNVVMPANAAVIY